eukprot:1142945-Pelagomonas_calceolata.AAC.4
MSDSSIFAAILEGVNKKLDSLIEQGNDQKLVNKKLEQKLYDVNKKMEGLNKKVEQKLDDVNKKMEGLNKNVGGLLEHSLRTVRCEGPTLVHAHPRPYLHAHM